MKIFKFVAIVALTCCSSASPETDSIETFTDTAVASMPDATPKGCVPYTGSLICNQVDNGTSWVCNKNEWIDGHPTFIAAGCWPKTSDEYIEVEIVCCAGDTRP